MAFQMATRDNKIPLRVPKATGGEYVVNTLEELEKVYQFEDLVSFLNVYNTLGQLLQTTADFKDLVVAYAAKVSSQGVKYAEVFFDPQTHTALGIPFETFMDGIIAGKKEAQDAHGIELQLICSMLRDWPVGTKEDGDGADLLTTSNIMEKPTAWLTAKQCVAYNTRNPGSIISLGLDNAEVAPLPGSVAKHGVVGFPPSLFTDIYAWARQTSGMLGAAHGGEEGPPEYVWEAIEDLGVGRVDHGVRAAEDPNLLNFMVRKPVPITICPLSNLKLKVFPQGPELNLLSLLDKDVLAMINSDDPAYFGGYVGDNFRFVAEQCKTPCGPDGNKRTINLDDIVRLAKNSFMSTYMPMSQKYKFLLEIDQYVMTHLN